MLLFEKQKNFLQFTGMDAMEMVPSSSAKKNFLF